MYNPDDKALIYFQKISMLDCSSQVFFNILQSACQWTGMCDKNQSYSKVLLQSIVFIIRVYLQNLSCTCTNEIKLGTYLVNKDAA